MKKISIGFVFLFLMAASFMQAQLLPKAATPESTGTIKNGTITYTVSVQSDDPQAAMLNNSTLEIAFNGPYSKLAGKIMGGIIGGNFIIDAAAKQGLALLDIMGQKKAIRMADEQINKAKNTAQTFDASNIQFLQGTKNIAGYTCKKALVKDPKNPGAQMIVYICESIQPESAGLMDNMLKVFKGFPLGIEFKEGNNKVMLMANEVSKKIPKKSDFDQSIPKEYDETTIEELEKEMNNMIGGGK